MMGRSKGTCSKCNRTGLTPDDYYSHVPAWCRDCFRDYQTGRHSTGSPRQRKSVRTDKQSREVAPIEFVPPGMDKKAYMKDLIKTPLGISEQMQQALVKGSKRNGPREVTSLAELPNFIKINADPGATYALEIASMIKSGTDNGKSIIEFWLRVLYDENVPLKYRFAVSQELANRLFGRPPQEITGSVDIQHKAITQRLGGLTDEELADLDTPEDLKRYITVEAVSRAIGEKLDGLEGRGHKGALDTADSETRDTVEAEFADAD